MIHRFHADKQGFTGNSFVTLRGTHTPGVGQADKECSDEELQSTHCGIRYWKKMRVQHEKQCSIRFEVDPLYANDFYGKAAKYYQ